VRRSVSGGPKPFVVAGGEGPIFTFASATKLHAYVMPWRIEDELKSLGANYVQAGAWKAFAIRDGNLITGQQNLSGAETARLIMEVLGR
jgi:hypothetical protein